MIDRIITNLENEYKNRNETLYIQDILESDIYIVIVASDKYGNVEDEYIKYTVYNKNNGNKEDVFINFRSDKWKHPMIPDQYQTYHVQTYIKLYLETEDETLDELNGYTEQLPVMLIYRHEKVEDIELPDLFAVSNLLLHKIAYECDVYEKESAELILKNERINKFMQLSLKDKIKSTPNEYYFYPKYLCDIVKISTDIIDRMNRVSSEGTRLSGFEINSIKANLNRYLRVAKNSLSNENDPFVNKEIVLDRVMEVVDNVNTVLESLREDT